MKLHPAAAAVVALLALAGCGGGSSPAADPSSPPGNAPIAAAPTVDKLDEQAKAAAGCKDAVKMENDEIIAHSVLNCRGQRLYVFANSAARDNWMKIASQFGTVEVRHGDTWLLTANKA